MPLTFYSSIFNCSVTMPTLMTFREHARSRRFQTSRALARNEFAGGRHLGSPDHHSATRSFTTHRRTASRTKAKAFSPIIDSYIETKGPSVLARMQSMGLLTNPGVSTTTLGLCSSEPAEENCSRYCENIVNIVLYKINCVFRASRKLFINKELGFSRSGPSVANRLVPARHLLYWCPRT
jgi:hypothetical protein